MHISCYSARYTPSLSHNPWFDHPKTIWWRAQIIIILCIFSFLLFLLS
jgi:hypothetical protein